MRLAPSLSTLPAIWLFIDVSAASAQMKDISYMDDARYYLLGSVGYADFNYNQSNISDVDGLSLPYVTVRWGLALNFQTFGL
ncbi:MAG: hypothetical protein CM15mP21_8190 [Hyphomicrobiales bacterium]|nr:MAG: hypothetical protein CM15mP21_8190 [Hyphomicrobiales bacterium]